MNPTSSRVCLTLPASVVSSNLSSVPTKVLIDSGAHRSFVDAEFVKTHNLSTSLLSHPIRLNMADGHAMQ